MPAKKSKEVVELPEAKNEFSKIILSILLVVAVAGLAALSQKYFSLKKELAVFQDPVAQQVKIKAETEDLVKKVGQLMVLPEGEPTIATVVDSQTLAKEQVFIKDAKNGDKVLIYKDKAIIYNPAENRIVNVGPVLSSGDSLATQQTAPVELSIEVRNGSQKIGVANEMGDRLKNAGFNVATVGNAVKTDYSEDMLINLTGKDVSALEKELSLTASDKLPVGEEPSTQDVLVILGNKK